MKNQKGFASLALIGVVVVLLAVGGYFLWHKKAEAPASVAQPVTQAPAVTQTNTPTSASVLVGWQTYSNSQYGFSIMYPTGTQTKESDISPGHQIYFSNSQGVQILEVNVITDAVKKGVFDSPPSCTTDFGPSSGGEVYTTKSGLMLSEADVITDFYGGDTSIKAIAFCTFKVNTDDDYEIIPQISASEASSYALNSSSNAIWNKMVASFSFTK